MFASEFVFSVYKEAVLVGVLVIDHAGSVRVWCWLRAVLYCFLETL